MIVRDADLGKRAGITSKDVKQVLRYVHPMNEWCVRQERECQNLRVLAGNQVELGHCAAPWSAAQRVCVSHCLDPSTLPRRISVAFT